MRILFLDDNIERCNKFAENFAGHTILFVHTAEVCIDALAMAAGQWDLVCLDHDLGGEIMVESGPGTGYEVACWLERNPEKQPRHIVIHSFNPDGAARMQQALPHAKRIPAVWDVPAVMVRDYLEPKVED